MVCKWGIEATIRTHAKEPKKRGSIQGGGVDKKSLVGDFWVRRVGPGLYSETAGKRGGAEKGGKNKTGVSS